MTKPDSTDLRTLAATALVVLLSACAGTQVTGAEKQPWNQHAIRAESIGEEPPAAQLPDASQWVPSHSRPAQTPQRSRSTSNPRPDDIARAKDLVARGVTFYRKGSYDEAETLLKQAMALYPFLAEGNLTLGKIFLIRGSAARDPALVDSARLMFEMVSALGGDSREADLLLELFRSVPE